MARVTPFPFTNAETTVTIESRRFVTVNLTTGEAIYPTAIINTNGVTPGIDSAIPGDPISVYSFKDVTRTHLVQCGGTVTKGAEVGGNTEGKAVAGAGGFIAMQAGVDGQYIDVISKEAF